MLHTTGLRFSTRPAASVRRLSGLQWAALGATVGVHVALWLLLDSAPRQAEPGRAAPLEVVWIEQPAARRWPVPPLPVPPRRPVAVAAAAAIPAPVTATPAADPPVVVNDRPRLLDDAARPLLPSAPATGARSFVMPGMPTGERRLFASRATLPGSAGRIVDVGDVRGGPTPQQVVLGVAQFLFGRPHPDSCDKVEARLARETDEVVRDIDLHTFEKYCRGKR